MTPNSTPNTTEHNSVTVQQAALILGISDEAVRARIRRGKLTGEKRGSTWVVHLSDEAGQETPQRDTTQHATRHPTQPTGQTQQNTTEFNGAAIDRHEPHDRADLVEHLQGEVTYLRERLEDAMGQLAAERERADVLQLRAIGSGAPDAPQEPPGSPQTRERGLHGVLAWVRRLWRT